MDDHKNYLVTFGGWYQRTTLHLSEVQAFLTDGTSRLKLSKERLHHYFEDLKIKKVSREIGCFEYISAETDNGIIIRYYEDGLYIFEKKSNDIEGTKKELNEYFDKVFNPAISYLFSLGAPTPKILADIKISHVAVVSFVDENAENYFIDQEKYGHLYSQINSGDIAVYKTVNYIFIVTKTELANTRDLIETQIFFREFKDQLERYLNIHRTIWEEIGEIKEKGQIRGGDVERLRAKLDGYQKTISLINSRISQMGTYANTRRSIAQKTEIEDNLLTLFQFRFEVLFDTLEYIKQIWYMTTDYVNQAIGLIMEIKNNNFNSGITNVRSLMVLGIMSMIFGTATMTKYPVLDMTGIKYVAFLMILSIIIDLSVKYFYRLKGYRLKFTERQKEFK